MKIATQVAAALLAGSLSLPGASLAQAQRSAPNTTFEGCVLRIDNGLGERGVRVSFTLAREGKPFRLTPQGFIHSSSGGPEMSLAQVAQWGFLLDQLRDAARGKFEVKLEVDSATSKVEYVRALYYKPC